jgi:nickel/cobalt transporter (NiCoT) family protein
MDKETGGFMRHPIAHLFSDQAGNLRGRIIGIYSLLIAYHLLTWLWAFTALLDHPILLSMAFLAYTLGLRHAVDADHIAAIDNVTRKLMQEGKRPISTGLFFSLGHSFIVMLACIGIAMVTSSLIKNHMSNIHAIAGIVCTLVSASFLLLIAFMNLVILCSTYKAFQEVRCGKTYTEIEFNQLGDKHGGFFSRHFKRLFGMITHSWQMFPLGMLFGLGFDTATEVALLGMTASEALNGISLWSVLIFPALFTAGMTLIDTTDCILMIGAYGWAFMKPIRKLYYNMTITFISVVIALFIGSMEVLGLIGDQLGMQGVIWDSIKNFNNHYGSLGYVIIAIFMASWLISVFIYRYMRLDDVEIN